MTELKVIATAVKKAPDYRKTAPALLAACRKFYENPENEKAFREWLEARSGGHDERADCEARG